MLNPSDNPPQQHNHPQPLQQLLHKYPFVFWGVIWAVVVSVGTGAIIGLFNPGEIEKEALQPTPTRTTIQESIPKRRSQPTPALTTFEEPTAKDLPLSLFGGLALGCAAGSFLVTRAIKQSTQRRQLPKRSKSKIRRKRRHLSKKRRPVPQMPKPASSQPPAQRTNEQQPTINDQQTQVTVLSADESHPLDGREEGLAEMLDLRKRQSLASLMRPK